MDIRPGSTHLNEEGFRLWLVHQAEIILAPGANPVEIDAAISSLAKAVVSLDRARLSEDLSRILL